MGCRERVWEFLLEDGLESRSQLREPPNVVGIVYWSLAGDRFNWCNFVHSGCRFGCCVVSRFKMMRSHEIMELIRTSVRVSHDFVQEHFTELVAGWLGGIVVRSGNNCPHLADRHLAQRGNIVIDYRHRMLTLMSYVGSRVTEAWEPFPFYRQRPRSEMVSGLIDDL